MAVLVIQVTYDEEARVWVAQSDDIPLVTEADTYEVLYRKMPDLIQDVLVENADPRAGTDVPFELVTSSRAAPRFQVA
ncbi:DUF1902 domain-containing protein [Rhodopseudomonas palustris]|uniref:DUF1902 domain-containing protein n=1 Tax=Rhodopseudomonas palustris TaxID=1076 RepID=UPI000E5AD082|nr:DUF1902 domain-containing protein [Rhodopseudomonas palustris]QLH73282.1 DUF1902 domain-containing protein [Rhodopseudomonas palustris]RHZ99571.1 DUF1902 domain-containing protein [Rhodopseudomonas palustris]